MINQGLWNVLLLTCAVTFILFGRCGLALDMGQLQCTENGIYPDDKLIGVVMQKCQPKLDDSKELLIACVTKCVLKQMKGLNKKGKIKKNEALKLASLLPSDFQEEGKKKFDECYEKFHKKIKKESKCDSFIPFSSCFMDFAESICKPVTTESP